MYIGPWQEYRLAKIQDDAIQRLRQEWEAQLRGQLPPGEDDRIRELMQPLMAKMPLLLLAAKSRTGSSSSGTRNGRLTGSRSGLNSESGSRCSSRPPSAQSNVSSVSVRSRTSSRASREVVNVVHRRTKLRDENNQETHDEVPSKVALKPPRPKKKSKKPLTALEQVQKRKKMFATWIKQAGNESSDTPGQTAKPETKEVDKTNIVTRLPPIHAAGPTSAAMLLGEDTKPKTSSSLTLPPLHRLSVSKEVSSDAQISHVTTIMSPQASALSNVPDTIDLDESVDEDEVNKLLNWTDTLLSPHAMDSLCNFDD